MKSLFGTDGIRGEAGKFPLDEPTVNIIGSSLTSYLGTVSSKLPVIVIGRDTRESGAWLERALITGASAAGAKCLSAGVITTPGVAYLTRVLHADAGVVISASHNPYHDNGIKIFAPSGQKIADSVERRIETDIFANAGTAPTRMIEALSNSSSENLRKRYLTFLTDEIGNGLKLNGLTVVLDCANGASSELAPALFEALGARVIATNVAPDGRNINLNCGSLHIESLQATVVAEQSNLGIAFDGDADRSLFVDAAGNFVDGDATLWVLANYLLKRQRLKQGIVIATVMSNIGLEIALRSVGVELVRTDVGDKYVLEELLRRGASLGGEQSGHIILPELSLAGDGMITALGLMRAMIEEGGTLQDLTSGFRQYPQVLLNVRVREKVAFSDLPAVQRAVKEVEERLSQNGRLLLRYSGTEPLARVMIEGANQSDIETYAERIAKEIRQEIGVSSVSP
ncbi:MAG TPA: phosphoglucosamine mutase [Pyrinomonadaceae bacterium]|jgi:phosphoglucosamine mutase|nr:phosphoglucosamine mutase [Pyrinomonadaceae bacterium]